MKYYLSVIVMVFALFASHAPARGQSSWDTYKPRKLQDIVKQHSDSKLIEGENTNLIFTGDNFPSRVKVIYTGKTRKITEKRKEHIDGWVKSYGLKPEIAAMFETELLFIEDSVEYWLPVQKQVIPYFEKELKAGETVTLFTVWIGAKKISAQWDWIFLVNEFEK